MTRPSTWLTAVLLAAGCTQSAGSPERTVRYELQDHWPLPADFAGLQPGMVLTTNNAEDTISIVDVEANEEVLRFPIGLFPVQLEGPHHLGIDPQNRYLYVPISNFVPGGGGGPHGSHGTGRSPGYLLKINAQTLLREAQVVVDRSPGDVLLSPDGSIAYVSHYDLVKIEEALARGGTVEDMASTVAIVDTDTMERRALVATCAGAHGMGLNADASRLYVSCALTDELAVVDVTTTPPSVTRVLMGQQRATPPDAVHEPYAVSVHPVSGKVYVSNLKSQSLRVYDPATGDVTAGPTFDASPMFGAFVNGGSHLMLPLREVSKVHLIDVETLQDVRPPLTMTPDVCTNGHQVERSADGQMAYLVCEGDWVEPGTLVSIAVPIFAVSSVLPIGVYPDAARVVLP